MIERRFRGRPRPLLVCFLVLLPACGNPSNDKLREWSRRAEALPPPAVNAGHTGPGVAPGGTGTGRFARAVYENFRADRAMKTAAYADRYYREPGNEGFEAVLDRVRTELSDAGYGKDDWLRIEEFETLMNSPAWTPRRARIRLLVPGEPERVLHELARPEDQDRTMLPRNAPSGEAEGRVVLAFDDVGPGSVLVTDDPLSKSRIAEARDKGAVAVLSGHLREWNEDPSGKGRHLDAIAYASVPAGCALPVAMISPRSLATIREAVNRHPEVRIAFESEVELAERPLRTLVATIIGTVAPDETVVLPAHVQEPGACDNASGVATMLEGARVLAELVRSEELELPGRSIAFVWGDEMAQSRVWIERSGRVAVAAIAADMTGQSREKTGAMALLERMPDPGAVDVLPPDEHTPWGSEPVEAASLVPHGLSLVARCAMVDVAGVASKWPTREHPFEGGSDHVVFLEHGTPAVLFWHFTDFAYHTSLDRLEHVDPEEMRRTGSAILVTALAVADARPMDLERYLESLRIERDHRIAACAVKNRDATAELWRTWCNRVRLQLVDMCLNARAEKDTIGPEGDLLDPKERP